MARDVVSEHAASADASTVPSKAGRRLTPAAGARKVIWFFDRTLILWLTIGLTFLAQGLIKWLNVPSYTLPPPSDVFIALGDNWRSLLNDLGTTVKELAIGLSLGLTLGILLGALLAESRLANKLIAPYVVAIVSTPVIVFAPLFGIWFNFDIWSKVLMIVLMTFAPLTVNAAQGFASLDNEKWELMRSLSASRFELNVKAKFPNALPSIFAGIKISAVLSVIAVVAAEFIGSQSGLGHTVYYAQTVGQNDLLIAAALILILIGLVLFYGVTAIEKRVIFWREGSGVSNN
jgi:ABC-type nitrate/sulfonate/bicarbonate transport system permease component